MSHLTDAQIQSLTDTSSPPGDRERLIRHVETCAECARELEFQRALARAIRKVPVHKTSRGFTGRVMGRVAPELKQAFLFRLFGGAGRTLAMAAVLGIVAYGLSLDLPGTTSETPGTTSVMFKELSTYYGAAREFILQRSTTLNTSVESNASTEGGQIVAMTLLVLAVLGLIDRFVLRNVVKIKPGRQTG